jgi:TonB family protein
VEQVFSLPLRSGSAFSALSPSPVELNLLLEWPQRSRREWSVIIGASLAFHLFFFFVAIRLPSFIARQEPTRRVILRHIPLYLPPDLLTQKAPNQQKISKSIDLADLLSSPGQQARKAAPSPSRKRLEIPRQSTPRQAAQNTPQILPELPKVALNQPQAPPPAGAINGLPTPAPPPPSPSPGPFQNIGSDAPPPNPHPTLAPPRANVQAATNGVPQDPNARRLSISDDIASESASGAPGAPGVLAAPHGAVELQSDPQGADFKPYLTRILAIVRANWRRVMPESARQGMLSGRTVMEFIINRDGSIPKLVIADSSGAQALDSAAVAGLSMSNPLPPLPNDYKGFQVRLAFTFSYNMPGK